MGNTMRQTIRRAALPAAALALAGCANFSILAPGSNATVASPVATDVFWNADLQPGTFDVVDVDASGARQDVTNQFAVGSTSSDSHATASLTLTQGTHTLQVSGNLWTVTSQAFSPTSTSRTFRVANGAGRPVTYTMTIFNFSPGWPAGTLGNVSFGGTDPQAAHPNVNLILTFDGNTGDVVPYFAPRPCQPNCTNHAVNDGSGFEIVAGTATITIQDAATGATIAQGTFLQSAGIFVSVDNGNGGIGFGCKGALPSDPSFPDHGIEVAYPYAQFSAPNTDLKTNYTAPADWALSCTGFNGSPGQPDPHGCYVPPSLATTAGALTITSNDAEDVSPAGVNASVFTVVVH